jgi:hypothetical protein
MPPRFAFWTILLDGEPTAFRARTQAELVPTLTQLRSRNPGAVMKWFARGRLWESPEEAHRDAEARRRPPLEKRGAGWRPGGQHQDPRERFKGAKGARPPARPGRSPRPAGRDRPGAAPGTGSRHQAHGPRRSSRKP